MNFGSEFALHDDSGEQEVVTEGDMSAGPLGVPRATLPAPPAAEASVLPPPPGQAAEAAVAASTVAASVAGAKTWKLKVDTNILNVDMATLKDAASSYATGNPIACKTCHACLSAVSILTPATGNDGDVDVGVDADVYDWVCEFCHEVNRVELDGVEKPVDGVLSVDYLLDGAPAAAAQGKGAGSTETKEHKSTVLFVIDTSWSMAHETDVDGRLELRDGRLEPANKPSNHRGDEKTYISELQFMQAAVDAQLETMVKEAPSTCVGLVTFSGSVSLFGDATYGSATAAEVTFVREYLSDEDFIRKSMRGCGPLLSRPVSESRPLLTKCLFGLRPYGGTAIGSAVVAALAMLKEHGGVGSRLVLCTDGGHASQGLGMEAEESFYKTLGRESRDTGVTVDAVSAHPCVPETLDAMVHISGGAVTSDFAGILANPIIASQVSVRVTLHKGLMFRNKGLMFRNVDDEGTDANTFTWNLGNVTDETELSFEYQVRDKAERAALGLSDNDHGVLYSPTVQAALPAAGTGAPAAAADAPTSATPTAHAVAETSLPFQVQIRYTRLDGTKCLRVLTSTQRVTSSKADAEKFMSMGIVAGHAAAQAGNMANKGAYSSARACMRAWSHLMQRNASTLGTLEQIQHYASEMSTLDTEVLKAQRSKGDDVEDMGGSVDYAAESSRYGRNRKTARARYDNDGLSRIVYASKVVKSKTFVSKGQ